MNRKLAYFLVILMDVVRGVKDRNDPGYDILNFMQRFQANLREPINLSEELICNCSHSGCSTEITRFLGNNYTGLCRSTSGICYKRLLPDGSVILSCLSKDASPDLHCRAKQPMNDGSVMQCCRNSSFCNGALNLRLIDDGRNTVDGIPLIRYIIVMLIVVVVILVIFILLALAWFNKPLKQCISYWVHRSSPQHSPQMTETVVVTPSNGLEHLGDLLSNLDDTASSGSGSGLPLLAERTISRQIDLEGEIGVGRFGEVWLGFWKGDPVAVKIFNSRDERSWNREIEIYQTNLLRHPNLLRFIASDNKDTGTATQLWLITEYHQHGSLYDYLSANVVPAPVMLQMIRSIVAGLGFLHIEIPGTNGKPAIAHRDLKSKNILVKSDLTCVVADLGLAVRYMNGAINLPDNNKCGTVRYLAPELLDDSFMVSNFEAYKRADMYSMGLIIWEIAWRCESNEGVCKFELPYFECVGRDPTVDEMKFCVCVQKRRPIIQKHWIGDRIMGDVVQMMKECWAESPASRLTAMNVRNEVDRHAANLGYKLQT